jgi:hypothetical protein
MGCRPHAPRGLSIGTSRNPPPYSMSSSAPMAVGAHPRSDVSRSSTPGHLARYCDDNNNGRVRGCRWRKALLHTQFYSTVSPLGQYRCRQLHGSGQRRDLARFPSRQHVISRPSHVLSSTALPGPNPREIRACRLSAMILRSKHWH